MLQFRGKNTRITFVKHPKTPRAFSGTPLDNGQRKETYLGNESIFTMFSHVFSGRDAELRFEEFAKGIYIYKT